MSSDNGTSTNSILIIGDDEKARGSIGALLERENLTPALAESAETGLEWAFARKPDLVLVDLNGSASSVDLCKKLRAVHMQTPIIILSALADEISKVLMLEIGADDYIVKPFSSRELLARIRALLRRTAWSIQRQFRFGDVEVDLDRRTVARGGEAIELTGAEYNLLAFFLQNADQMLTREAILSSVWGYQSYPNTRTVDAHVVRLRRKLEPDPNAPRYILTIHGAGYRFRGDPDGAQVRSGAIDFRSRLTRASCQSAGRF